MRDTRSLDYGSYTAKVDPKTLNHQRGDRVVCIIGGPQFRPQITIVLSIGYVWGSPKL